VEWIERLKLCTLLNHVNNSDCTTLNGCMIINNELERMWKEAAMALICGTGPAFV
jgi:hypothetical protein